MRDYHKHLVIAHASLREAGYLLELAHRLGFVSSPAFEQCHAQYDETSKVLAGLVRSMNEKTHA